MGIESAKNEFPSTGSEVEDCNIVTMPDGSLMVHLSGPRRMKSTDAVIGLIDVASFIMRNGLPESDEVVRVRSSGIPHSPKKTK